MSKIDWVVLAVVALFLGALLFSPLGGPEDGEVISYALRNGGRR